MRLSFLNKLGDSSKEALPLGRRKRSKGDSNFTFRATFIKQGTELRISTLRWFVAHREHLESESTVLRCSLAVKKGFKAKR